jgi:hypothetical protein
VDRLSVAVTKAILADLVQLFLQDTLRSINILLDFKEN